MTTKSLKFPVSIRDAEQSNETTMYRVFTSDEHSIELQFEILDIEDLSGKKAEVLIYTEDKSLFVNDAKFVSPNIYSYTMKPQEDAHRGRAITQLVLNDGGNLLTSPKFIFEIERAISDEVVQESGVVQTWEDFRKNTENWVDDFEKEVNDWKDEVQGTIKEVNDELLDIARGLDTAEEARVRAENIRESNESKRKNAESDRNRQESQRISNEQQRETNENNRIRQEDLRANSEGQRSSAEESRKSNERERVNAENQRKQTFDSWDKTMNGVIPNADSYTAGTVKVDSKDNESKPYAVYSKGKIDDMLEDAGTEYIDRINTLSNDLDVYRDQAAARSIYTYEPGVGNNTAIIKAQNAVLDNMGIRDQIVTDGTLENSLFNYATKDFVNTETNSMRRYVDRELENNSNSDSLIFSTTQEDELSYQDAKFGTIATSNNSKEILLTLPIDKNDIGLSADSDSVKDGFQFLIKIKSFQVMYRFKNQGNWRDWKYIS